MSDAWIFCRVTSASGSVVPNTGPIATPAETGMPWNLRSVRVSGAARGWAGQSLMLLRWWLNPVH